MVTFVFLAVRRSMLAIVALVVGSTLAVNVLAVTPSGNDVATGVAPNGVITVTDAGVGGTGYCIPVAGPNHDVTGTPTNGSAGGNPAWQSNVQYLSGSFENGIVPPPFQVDSHATEVEWSDDIQLTISFPSSPTVAYTITLTDSTRIRWDYVLDATLGGSYAEADLRTYDAPIRVDDGVEPTWSEINHWHDKVSNGKATKHFEKPDHSRANFVHNINGAASPATTTVVHFRADSRVNAVHNCSADGGDGKMKVISKTTKWDINKRRFGLTITP